MSTFDAENAGNFEEIEMQFAVKTVEHLEVSRPSLTHSSGVKHRDWVSPRFYTYQRIWQHFSCCEI